MTYKIPVISSGAKRNRDIYESSRPTITVPDRKDDLKKISFVMGKTESRYLKICPNIIP